MTDDMRSTEPHFHGYAYSAGIGRCWCGQYDPATPKPDTPDVGEPGYVIWRAWRDGMLDQGRYVATERMAWETLDSYDKELDARIEREATAQQAQRIAALEGTLRETVNDPDTIDYEAIERLLSESETK